MKEGCYTRRYGRVQGENDGSTGVQTDKQKLLGLRQGTLAIWINPS